MRFQIEHETRLEFASPIREQYCELRLTPFDEGFQSVRSFELSVWPTVPVRSFLDAFGNTVHTFEVLGPHAQLVTRARSIVDTHLDNPFNYPLYDPADESRWMEEALTDDPTLWQFILAQSSATPHFHTLPSVNTAPRWDKTQPLQTSVLMAMNWVADTLQYESGSSDIHMPLADVLAAGKGVCQDFAHLFISLLRSWSLPARYVMGYTDVRSEAEERQPLATHAWVDVWLPGVGWRGFDATNRLVANDQYVRVAVGRDYLDASPQRGTYKGNASDQSPHVKLILSTPAETPTVLVGSGPSDRSSEQ